MATDHIAPIDLAGVWKFELDPSDVGVAEGWHRRPLAGMIELPGSLQAAGYGDPVTVDTPWTGTIIDRSWFTEERYAPYREPGSVKVPFWLQPERYYKGAAWYQCVVTVPEGWDGRRVTLTLERPHWETRAWLDDRALGSDDTLAAPHVYDLGAGVAPGRHTLTVRVDNRMVVDVGPNAHSMTDHTQSNWNGIVGAITLAAGSPVWIADLQVFPRVAERSALVRLSVQSAAGPVARARVRLAAALRSGGAPARLEADVALDGGRAELLLPLGPEARLWDEFSPELYDLGAEVVAEAGGAEHRDTRATTFGLREVSVAGTQIALNGRPLFLRGTLECCIFPLTGYPPTDEASWRRIIRACQAHGLNHIRFHSWCPPEAAFRAADELGFTYQVECSSWANQGATVGDGGPLDAWLYREAERIIAAYGNHPSFILMAYGNEPGGEGHVEYLRRWVTHWRAAEPRRLHTTGAGWPALEESDYHCIPEPRIQAWGAELTSRINARPPETTTDYRDFVERLAKPIVSHEIGQWCVFPNLAEIEKYTGVLRPRNFEIFRDLLEAHHMGDQAHDFLMASGTLQALCYKEEIESALRTPGFAGFQLLDLHDFPGQGTALVGVLDPFWDSKGYIAPERFRRFCASTVPLARLERRTWRVGETLAAELEVAHFGPADLRGARVTWRLEDDRGATLVAGDVVADIPTGRLTHVGAVRVTLGGLAPARRYRLAAGVAGTAFENDWDIWVFADELGADPEGVLVTEALDEEAAAHLAAGGAVLLALPPALVRADSEIGFSSIFWNTAWTQGFSRDGRPLPKGQAPHTLGILCDPSHPALAEFPTGPYSDWQWWDLIHGAAAMTLDHLPPALRPLVQPIDTWFESRRLGLLFEARVGGGRLLVCSMNLAGDLEGRPVARQMRRSLLAYAASDAFQPRHELAPSDIEAICTRRNA